MQEILFFRRSFRFDGGAEMAAQAYLEVLQELGSVKIVCEKWSYLENLSPVTVKVKGFTRKQKLLNFVTRCQEVMQLSNAIRHSHELIPGSHIVRLGDGLHSAWVRRAKPKQGFFSDKFHDLKIRLERETLSSSQLKSVIVNSEFVGEEVRSVYGISNYRVIRNTVREFFIAANHSVTVPGKTLIFVGSGWDRKGLDCALELLKLLPDFNLRVYGSDKNENWYLRYAQALGVAERVCFLGAIPVTPEIYRGSLALIHPARYEPFPNVATEALSQGVPVISSLDSGTSDFSRDQGVWTVSDTSGSALKDALEDIASSSVRVRRRYRDHILQFDKNYLKRKLVELYSAL